MAFLFWIVLFGKVTVESCAIGLLLVLAVAALMKVLFSYSLEKDAKALRKIPLFVGYVFVLLWAILKSNLDVMGLVLKGNGAIEPTIVTFNSGLKTEFGRFLLANSITLTPGTISVEVKDDVFVVHCLRRSMLDITAESTFCRWIGRLEA